MTAPPLRKNRNFVLLQSGQLLSTLGNQTSVVAYPLLVLAVTHSPAKAGLVAFAGILPYPLFVLPAGLVADRWDRKRVMIVTDVVRALALGGLVAAIAGGDPPFALIFAVAFIDGTAFAFFNIAEVGALRAVVPREQVPAAAAAEQARRVERRPRRAAPGRVPVRPRTLAPVPARRRLVRVLARLGDRDPDPVPGAGGSSRRELADAARRGVPLALGTALSAGLRHSLRVHELRRERALPLPRGRGAASRVELDGDRHAHRGLRRPLTRRLADLPAGAEAHVHARDPRPHALVRDRHRPVRDRAERLGPHRRDRSARAPQSVAQRGGDRLPRSRSSPTACRAA